LIFDQGFFDVICSDLDTVPLSRAAAASSAVPVVLSPVTINNYGGTCNYQLPSWVLAFTNPATMPRPAARASQRLKELAAYNDSVHRPYLHLVDGGVADNVALRGVLDIVEGFEALHLLGQPTPLDHVRRIIIFVVNSHSSPMTTWDENENSPGNIQVLLKATGVPIEKYSFEAMELLRDTVARWNAFRKIRDSVAFSADRDPTLKEVVNAPDVDLYAIDVSFPALEDKAEFEYLNNLPTSFVLSNTAVDHLRAAASTIILQSPDFQRLLKDVGATIVDPRPADARPVNGEPKHDVSVND
jgi:NTE family protein